MSSRFQFEQDPFQNFLGLIENARSAHVPDHNAMTLSTINLQGHPSSRIVLYKGLIREGLSFYTNYNSEKAQELQRHPYAALTFFWPQLEEQIRIEGEVKKLTPEESDAYFVTRPRLSQIGAWASDQSKIIPDFQTLEDKVESFEKKFTGQEVPRPPNWGGFHLLPQKFEFWFGRQGRLHQRYVYEKSGADSMRTNSATWNRSLKSP